MDELLVQPWVGTSWEGWVIDQVLVSRSNWGVHYDGPYYLRTNDGYEIDLIFGLSGTTYAIEIKLTSSPGQGDMRRLNKTADMIGAATRVLISRTPEHIESDIFISTNPRRFLQYLKKKYVKREVSQPRKAPGRPHL